MTKPVPPPDATPLAADPPDAAPSDAPPPLPRWIIPALVGVLVAGVMIGLAIPPVLGAAERALPNRPGADGAPNNVATALSPSPPARCVWRDDTADGERRRAGKPPATGEPRTGTATMALQTNLGTIEIRIDMAKTPCAAASFRHLAGVGYFDKSACHRMFTGLLQCGDPTGTGRGRLDYQFDNEGLPRAEPLVTPCGPNTFCVLRTPTAVPTTDYGYPMRAANIPDIVYPRGTVSMANAGPDTNGSQFFFAIAQLTLPASYTQFGTVTSGMDIIDRVAAGGHDGSEMETGGKPKASFIITSISFIP